MEAAELLALPWFHASLDRNAAESLLIAQGAKDGAFLVRQHSTSPDAILSVCKRARVSHHMLHVLRDAQKREPRYSLHPTMDEAQGALFASVETLIEYYCADHAPAPGPLTDPVLNPTAAAEQAEAIPRSRSHALASYSGPRPKNRSSDEADSLTQAALAAASAVSARASQDSSDEENHSVQTHRSLKQRPADFSAGRPGLVSLAGFTLSSPGILVQSEPPVPVEIDTLLCEGPLHKLRGAFQNRVRWFVLTTKQFAYFTTNCGDLIAKIDLENVSSVVDIDETKFRLSFSIPFGASQTHEMLLEAPTYEIKFRWLKAFLAHKADFEGFDSNRAFLLAEGYIQKLIPGGTGRKLRWFRATSKKLSYFYREGDRELGSIPWEFVTQIDVVRRKEFIIYCSQPFTSKGSYEAHLRCESEALRNRWVTALKKVLPGKEFLVKD
eukprot:m.417492 g.417492  ORF g.417492 m.417492 type:complete len:440 (+) comp56619_c0_seq1:146-1465(+)